MKHQDLLIGLIRLHILHHAAKEEFYGQWMIHELARHGYTLSPGTLYPMLHALERKGYLRSREERLGRTYRRIYRATALGRAVVRSVVKAHRRRERPYMAATFGVAARGGPAIRDPYLYRALFRDPS